jgi:hypothetical protein
MKDEGQYRCKFLQGDNKRALDFRVTDVVKPLASVAKTVDRGNTAVFTKEGGYIGYIQRASGEKLPLRRTAHSSWTLLKPSLVSAGRCERGPAVAACERRKSVGPD